MNPGMLFPAGFGGTAQPRERENMSGILQKLISRVAALALGASVVLMSFQILFRFFFNAPLTWTEEVDRYLFVWVVYLGSAVAVAMNAHIRVTFVVDLGGPKIDRFSRILDRYCFVFASAYAAYYGLVLAYGNLNASFYTLDFMPLVLFYLSVPTGMLLICFFALRVGKPEKAEDTSGLY